MFNVTGSGTRCNISSTLKTDLPNIQISYNIRDKSPNSKDYDKVVTSGSFSTCKMQQGVFGSLVEKIINNIFTEFSNIKLECPFKKGFYNITDAPLSEPAIVPGFLSGKSAERTISLKFSVKFKKVKSLVTIVSLDIFGTKDVF